MNYDIKNGLVATRRNLDAVSNTFCPSTAEAGHVEFGDSAEALAMGLERASDGTELAVHAIVAAMNTIAAIDAFPDSATSSKCLDDIMNEWTTHGWFTARGILNDHLSSSEAIERIVTARERAINEMIAAAAAAAEVAAEAARKASGRFGEQPIISELAASAANVAESASEDMAPPQGAYHSL